MNWGKPLPWPPCCEQGFLSFAPPPPAGLLPIGLQNVTVDNVHALRGHTRAHPWPGRAHPSPERAHPPPWEGHAMPWEGTWEGMNCPAPVAPRDRTCRRSRPTGSRELGCRWRCSARTGRPLPWPSSVWYFGQLAPTPASPPPAAGY